MTNLVEYTKITFAEAFRRNLHHAGVEERVDADGVKRAYDEASMTFWDVYEEVDKDPTAQDVVDALRLALMSQKGDAEAAKLTRVLLEFAPETDNDRGVKLLLRMIAEGSLKVELCE